MKHKIFNVLKIVGVAAGGALIYDPGVQASVQSIVPAPYNVFVGVGFGLAALWLKPPKQAPQPGVPEAK
jgi:hypothetical protein